MSDYSQLSPRHKLGAWRLAVHLMFKHRDEARVLVKATPQEFLAYTSVCDKCVSIMRWYE